MAQAKLYQYEVCPFCWKVRTLLALKNIAYEKIEVHPLNKREISFSSYKKVPILVDETGHQVNDSNVIMEYIDGHYVGRRFFEKDPERAQREKVLLEWSDTYVRCIPPLIYDTLPNALKAFDYITTNTKFSWYQRSLIKYSGAAVMKFVASKSKTKQKIEDPTIHFMSKLKEWTNALDSRLFAGGEFPNAADAAVYGITMSLSGLPASRLIAQEKEFLSWLLRMQELTQLHFSFADAS